MLFQRCFFVLTYSIVVLNWQLVIPDAGWSYTMKVMLEPIKAESLTGIFVSRFEKLILSGEFSIGQKLPSERELALQLGVSRPVVHEGLMDLAHKGLITMKPRVGAVVSDYRTNGSLAILSSLVSYNEGEVDEELADSMLEMRALFEIESARLAAKNRTKEHLLAFEKILSKEKKQNILKTKEVTELDFQFHHQIANASGNLVYPLLINSFKKVYTNLSGIFFKDTSIVKEVFESHQMLFDAIKQSDLKRSVSVMKKILKHGEKHFKALRNSR